MSRTFQRVATVVAGMALPLSAWALASQASPDADIAGIIDEAAIAAEAAVATDAPIVIAELPEPALAAPAFARTDRADVLADLVAKPEAVTTGCCIWVYYHGHWYCYPC